jgi:ABC-type sugar transport system ATPase subunit
MVFQSYALYPHMTVFENMAFALQVRKMRKEEIEKRVIETAKTLKIEELLDRKPKELSGGQRQRVAIGRATVRNPYAFLFDEPLSNLDCALRCKMRYELAKLKSRLNTTMVYVTHDQAEAMTLADKIAVMRDGAVEQVGTPAELYNSPINTFVAKFIGSAEMNIIRVFFIGCSGKLRTFATEAGERFSVSCEDINPTEDKCYYIGVRPEDVKLLSSGVLFFGNRVEAVVSLSENLGGEGFLHTIIKDGTSISAKTKTVLPPNSVVTLGFPIGKTFLFDHNQSLLSGVAEHKTSNIED